MVLMLMGLIVLIDLENLVILLQTSCGLTLLFDFFPSLQANPRIIR